MKIQINKLTISNFKGIQDKVIDFDSKKTVIAGRNEAGKTTVSDSFFWLAFGKDSKFRSKFDIIPLDKDNNPIHHLETSVEGDLILGDEQHTLKRVLTEKWTKKRGTGEEKELTGTVTNFFIDGSPVKKTEYDQYIASIIDEERFKLLTSTTYFNEQMSWQDRRKILTDLINEVTYEDLVQGHGFSLIREDILKSGVEKTENKYRFEIKELNKNLENIPARIDEVSKNINRDSAFEEREILEKRDMINKVIEQSKAEANEKYITSGNLLRDKISKLGQEIANLDTGNSTLEFLQKSKKTLNLQISNFVSEIRSLNNGIKNNADKIDMYDKERKGRLTDNWKKLNASTYDPTSATCPTCGQTLPEGDIEQARENFYSDRKKGLSDIVAKGTKLKENIEVLNEENESKVRLANAKKADLEEAKNSLVETESLIAEEESQVRDNSALIRLQEQKKDAESELRNLNTNTNKEVIEGLQLELDVINGQLVGYQSSIKAIARVEQLEKELAESVDKGLEIEKKLDVLSKLKLKYVNTVEGDLNKLFKKKISIRLFEKQVNGGFRETCDVLVQNRQGATVPWQFVNTGGQINSSLQIINLISKHLDVFCPVFIDHAESVDDIFEIDSQVIELEKVTSYPELVVK